MSPSGAGKHNARSGRLPGAQRVRAFSDLAIERLRSDPSLN